MAADKTRLTSYMEAVPWDPHDVRYSGENDEKDIKDIYISPLPEWFNLASDTAGTMKKNDHQEPTGQRSIRVLITIQ
eukprot:scaffold24519_cov53-Attheya_sp.AAC.4